MLLQSQVLQKLLFKFLLITFCYQELRSLLTKNSKTSQNAYEKIETMSQLSDFGYDDDTASSTFLGDLNEDMCYGFLYTPLE